MKAIILGAVLSLSAMTAFAGDFTDRNQIETYKTFKITSMDCSSGKIIFEGSSQV